MYRNRLLRDVLIAFRTIHTGRRLEADYLAGLEIQSQRNLAVEKLKFRVEAFQPSTVKTPVHDQFAKVGVKKFLDDMEMSLKQKNFILANDLHMLCGLFFRLSSLNELCQNQVVETCGLERIVNLLRMIVERQEQFKGAKSLELLCHGLSKLNIIFEDKPVNDRLEVLLKPIVPQLLSRIFACEQQITLSNIMRLSKVVKYDFSDDEKTKIARLVWKKFQMNYKRTTSSRSYFALLDMAKLFVKLDVNEEKGSFEWVDDFLEYWISHVGFASGTACRLRAHWYLNFVLIGLKNGKYNVVNEQKVLWSSGLRENRSFILDSEVETLMRYVERMPMNDETCKQLAEECNLL
uniref:Uncharacterized protein n=1 Tax=Romanomermis culicivorax TaxID=13658 RepID=A0A915J7A6_ROMCU